MQEPGVGLVSMSPYADMVARNRDAVDRLYQSGLASSEGKEIFRNLREFAAKNGIEARHLHALADDVRNHELEKAQWADKGIDFSTVQSLDEGTARLGNSILEEGKSLPDVERTALEREVAALDTLFEDTDATNLLARAAEGDNNAANEFRKTASEYGIGADTIGDLIQARTSDRSANRAPAYSATAAYSTFGTMVLPSVDNGRVYQLIAGSCPATPEPVWPIANGATVSNGGCTWKVAGNAARFTALK